MPYNLGRMYLITEEQFNEVHIKTFTIFKMFTKNLPVQKYLKVIEDGISETYTNLSKYEIEDYLKSSINN